MASGKARFLKELHGQRWGRGVLRELLVFNVLNMFLPSGYRALFTGIGAGEAVLRDESYSNPLNAFDFTVFNERWEPVAFVEVTGVERDMDMERGKGLCVGAWKLWKAERFGVTDKAWYMHVVTSRQSIRVASYNMLKQNAGLHRLHEGHGWHGMYYCMHAQHWHTLDTFIKWLARR